MAIPSGARKHDKSQGLPRTLRERYKLRRDVVEILLRSAGGSRHIGGWFSSNDPKSQLEHLRKACESVLNEPITVLQMSRIKAVLLDVKALEEEF